MIKDDRFYSHNGILIGNGNRILGKYNTQYEVTVTTDGTGTIYIDNTWLATGPISQFTTLNFKVGISNKPVEMTVSALNMSQFSNYNKALEHLGVS